MSLDDLIHAASSGPLKADDVERAASQLGATVDEMFDVFARRIADGYTRGELDFAQCDAAMGEVFTYAHVTTDLGLSRFAWGVFEAFDQGEFRGEGVTQVLIATVLRRGFLIRGDGCEGQEGRSEEGREAGGGNEGVRGFLRVGLASVVAVLSAVVGAVLGILAARTIPPHEIAPGMTRWTSLGVAAFLVVFTITLWIGVTLGMHRVEKYLSRDLPQA